MKQWYVRGMTREQKIKFLQLKQNKKIALDDYTLKYLILEGYDTVEKIYNHLYFKEKDIPSITLAKDADKFVNRLIYSLSRKDDVITMVSDYDTDGINSAAIFIQAMDKVYKKVNLVIPHRIEEGYGLSIPVVDRVLKEFPDTKLIVTADNGIVAFEAVDYANSLGIDVIISDHHEPSEDGKIPNALAVVDPKRLDDDYPFKDLCGAGLIFKLVYHFYKMGGVASVDMLRPYLAYVACATVGDLVPLTSENRYYVKEGIKVINNGTVPCFNTLNHLTESKGVDEETIGFKYSPIMNAIGRIEGDAKPVVEFLIEQNNDKSLKMCEDLIAYNTKRKDLCSAQENIALKAAQNEDKVIVLYSKDFHEGIVGIIAGKVKEAKNRPTFILTDSSTPGLIKGSARSIKGFNLKRALDMNAHLLEKYGGHELAAGLTLKKENLAKFKKAMDDLLDDKNFFNQEEEKITVDFLLKEEDINSSLIDTLTKFLKPFGQGFDKPKIAIRDFQTIDIVGMPLSAAEDDKKHLKLCGKKVDIICFNGYQQWKSDGGSTNIKCIGFPSVNFFKGKPRYQFNVESPENIRDNNLMNGKN